MPKFRSSCFADIPFFASLITPKAYSQVFSGSLVSCRFVPVVTENDLQQSLQCQRKSLLRSPMFRLPQEGHAGFLPQRTCSKYFMQSSSVGNLLLISIKFMVKVIYFLLMIHNHNLIFCFFWETIFLQILY